MRGGIILSNRLRAMQEAAENFGESVAGTREAQRKAKLEEADRAAMAKSRAIQDRAATTAADAADLQLGDFKRRDAARQEAEGFASQLTDFGRAVPDSTIEAPSDGMLPDFGGMRSERPVMDTTAQSVQDRIRASWMNADARAKGETSAFTVADIQKKREADAMAKQAELSAAARKREIEDRDYGLDERRVKVSERERNAQDKADRYKEIVDEKGNVHRWNMDTNQVEPVGIKKKVEGSQPADVQDAITQAEIGLGIIDQMVGSEDGKVKAHPGFASAVGSKVLSPSYGFGFKEDPVEGSNAADFMSLYDQITGQAFMTAFQNLRGGGQITQQEGDKATAAITRMKTSTSEKEFVKAANEFRAIIRKGLESAKRKGAGPGASSSWGPKAGAVEGGYRFKGGNPADPNNWEKQ